MLQKENQVNGGAPSANLLPELSTFSFDNKRVRIFEGENGEPIFIARDIAVILELGNNRQAVSGLHPDDLTSVIMTSGGQRRSLRAVNESGLYSLIFKSRKPAAKRFQRWVTSEVLPSIRKHGCYIPLKTLNSGDFEGLMPIQVHGRQLLCYTEVLRKINRSTRSGSVQKRRQKYGNHFFKLFGRNFVTIDFANQLRDEKLLEDNKKRLQLELPFNQEGGAQ